MNEIIAKLDAYYVQFLKAIPRFAMAIILLVAGILIANWITGIFKRKLNKRSHDQLMSSFLAKAIKLVLIICIFLLSLNAAGLNSIAAAILATAGASAIVLGFAFKDIAENFLAGIILAFNRPFNVDDTVQIEDVFGKIKSMEFRYTKIRTFDGRNVYIPNSDVLTKPVFNYTEEGFYRAEFTIGIAYDNNASKAKEIIQKSLDENTELIHDDEHYNFAVEHEIAASTVNFKVFMWISTQDFRKNMIEIRGRAITHIKTSLESNGFNLPSDIREIKFNTSSKPFLFGTEKVADKN